jgi:hypothetical protein
MGVPSEIFKFDGLLVRFVCRDRDLECLDDGSVDSGLRAVVVLEIQLSLFGPVVSAFCHQKDSSDRNTNSLVGDGTEVDKCSTLYSADGTSESGNLQ